MPTTIRNLSPAEVRAMLQRDEIVLIDVREPAEFGAERIHGALNLPLSTFDPLALPRGARETVVLHCGSGVRSVTAIERCRAAGLSIDAHLAGGLKAWRAQGFPTVRLDPNTGGVIDLA